MKKHQKVKNWQFWRPLPVPPVLGGPDGVRNDLLLSRIYEKKKTFLIFWDPKNCDRSCFFDINKIININTINKKFYL
jgi:hypothetical protein